MDFQTTSTSQALRRALYLGALIILTDTLALLSGCQHPGGGLGGARQAEALPLVGLVGAQAARHTCGVPRIIVSSRAVS